MEDFNLFKEFVSFCKSENISEARFKDFEIKLKTEFKLNKELGDANLNDLPEADENFEDVLFHSVGK